MANDKTMSERLDKDGGWGKKFYNSFNKLLLDLPQAYREGYQEQMKANAELQKLLSKNAKRDQETLELFKENLEEIKKLAATGDKDAQQFVKVYTENGDKTLASLEKIRAGAEISEKEARATVNSMGVMTSIMEKSGKSLDINFTNILKNTLENVKNSKLNIDERRESISTLKEMLKVQKAQKNLTDKGLDVWDFLKENNLELKDLTKEQVELFEKKITPLLSEFTSVTVNKVAGPLAQLEEKFKLNVSTAKDSEDLLGKLEERRSGHKALTEKVGLSPLAKTVKAGGADALLGQFGLGGIGLGAFVTDFEKMKELFKSIGRSIYKTYNFFKSLPEKLGSFIKSVVRFKDMAGDFFKSALEPITKTISKASKSIKNMANATMEGIAKIGGKLSSVGSSALDLISKSAKGLKGLLTKTFDGISSGFSGFWDVAGKAMTKGKGLMGSLLSGVGDLGGSILSGGSKALGGIGGAILSGGGKLLGGLGKLGGKALGGAGKLLGGAAKFAGPLGLALTAGMAGYDFYKGYSDPNEIAGVGPDEKLGTGKKIQAGAANAISGLSFGLVDPKTVFKGIQTGLDFLFGDDGILTKTAAFFKDVGSKLTLDNIKGLITGIVDTVSDLFSSSGLKNSLSGIMTSIQQIFSGDKMIEGIGNLMSSIFNAIKSVILGFTPGGMLAKKVADYFGFGGGSSSTTPTNGLIPTIPRPTMANPIPTGDISTLDAAKAKSVAKADVVNAAIGMQNQNANTAAPAQSSSSFGKQGNGSFRTTQVDDLGLATLNSILFE